MAELGPRCLLDDAE